jgi:hypothetical protein
MGGRDPYSASKGCAELVLPGADRVRRADLDRGPSLERAHDIGDQPVEGPVAAADDVAGPRAGDPRRMAVFAEERGAVGARHEFGTALRGAVGRVRGWGLGRDPRAARDPPLAARAGTAGRLPQARRMPRGRRRRRLRGGLESRAGGRGLPAGLVWERCQPAPPPQPCASRSTRYETGRQSSSAGPRFQPSAKAVSYLVERLAQGWGGGAGWHLSQKTHPHEATYLKVPEHGDRHRKRPRDTTRRSSRAPCRGSAAGPSRGGREPWSGVQA